MMLGAVVVSSTARSTAATVSCAIEETIEGLSEGMKGVFLQQSRGYIVLVCFSIHL
jgi:hypothetical protein